jgi:hypothetical protein
MKEELASATKSTPLIGSFSNSKRGPSVSNIEKLKKYFEKIEKQEKNVHAKSGNKKTSNNSD